MHIRQREYVPCEGPISFASLQQSYEPLYAVASISLLLAAVPAKGMFHYAVWMVMTSSQYGTGHVADLTCLL